MTVTSATTGKLRFAIVMDSISIPQWKFHCIKEIMKYAELRFVWIREKQSRTTGPVSLFSTYEYFSSQLASSLKKVHAGALIKEARVHRSSYQLEQKYLESLKKDQVDFIMKLDNRKLTGDLLNVTKYGTWAFGFLRSEYLTRAALYQLTDDQNQAVILKKGYVSTVKESLSSHKENAHSIVTSWPALVCRDILNNQADYFRESLPENVKINDDQSPANIKMAKFMKQLLRHKGKYIIDKLFRYEYWNVGIIHQPISSLLQDSSPEIDWLVPKPNVYYADPFIYRNRDRLHILMEEIDYKTVNGYISTLQLPKNEEKPAKVSVNSSIINNGSHMSYPYVVEYENQTFCVPETAEEKEVALYKLDPSTERWRKEKVLIKNFPGVDATLVRHGDYWWLFCTKAYENAQSQNSELHIFYATDLFNEWNPHALNPVKVDVRSSRPAGTPFTCQGSLFRPAQDCSYTYGGRIVLNTIHTLTSTRFRETPLSYISPREDSLYPHGLHTISPVGDFTIVDGKRFDYHFSHFFKKLYRFKVIKANRDLLYSVRSKFGRQATYPKEFN